VASARVALAPPRLKVEHAAVDTTKPFVAHDVMFVFSSHAQFLSLVVALRIERSATRLSDAFERPALDYRVSIQQSAPCGGFEPTLCGLKGRHPQTNRRTGLVYVSFFQFIFLKLRLRAP
jgi:hypothetical protein